VSKSQLEIRSFKGTYRVKLDQGLFSALASQDVSGKQYIVDAKVAKLYEKVLSKVLKSGKCLLIEATEENKNLDQFTSHIEKLVAQGVRRGNTLVAIGGGVIQDITCFLAATMFRGLDWTFYPTTLLAQADSCIGSKSSINVGAIKNLLGTFTPPKEVFIDPSVLKTLGPTEIRSGLGEMLKIHIIDGPASFSKISAQYGKMLEDSSTLLEFVFSSLEIKKRFIEQDELDQGIRNVLNYGHSFGHAIEAATDFAIPHGIAVTLGMDMANFVALRKGRLSETLYQGMHSTLRKNYAGFEKTPVPFDRFLSGLSKDKKNRDATLGLILLGEDGVPTVGQYPKDSALIQACTDYFATQTVN